MKTAPYPAKERTWHTGNRLKGSHLSAGRPMSKYEHELGLFRWNSRICTIEWGM